MRNTPLAVKIWMVFASITLCLFLLLAFLLPWTLKGFFTEQMYDILLDSQNAVPSEVVSLMPVTGEAVLLPSAVLEQRIMAEPRTITEPSSQTTITEPSSDSFTRANISTLSSSVVPLFSHASGPGIQHMMLSSDGNTLSIGSGAIPQPFAMAIEQDADQQRVEVGMYSRKIEAATMFYAIRKQESAAGASSFMISYAWGNYRNDLVMTMYWRLILLMVVLIVVSWLPCLWLARYLTRPLILMEQQVGRVAERDWHEPFILNRKDEMGRLASSFESMRQRFVRQDKSQQFFLQNISHELKTPVMVIYSYAQSILDGIYPKGTIKGSVEIIISEAERLDKRIRDLLYLNKLNYLSTREGSFRTFNLSAVVGDCIERLRFRRPELEWTIDLPQLEVEGDADQWGVAIENVLDNQLRYAKQRISVTIEHAGQGSDHAGGFDGVSSVDNSRGSADSSGNGDGSSSSSGSNSSSSSGSSSNGNSRGSADSSGNGDGSSSSCSGSNNSGDGGNAAVQGAGVAIRIGNDGPLIEDAELSRIFDQFETGPNGQFGLGLAIAKQIMAYHQANIRVMNEASGPVFYLEPGAIVTKQRAETSNSS